MQERANFYFDLISPKVIGLTIFASLISNNCRDFPVVRYRCPLPVVHRLNFAKIKILKFSIIIDVLNAFA